MKRTHGASRGVVRPHYVGSRIRGFSIGVGVGVPITAMVSATAIEFASDALWQSGQLQELRSTSV